MSDGELRKKLTELKQKGEYKWLYNYSNNITKQAVKYNCTQIRLECIGWVRLGEKNRIPADDHRITSLRVTRQGNNWFASINVIQKEYRNQFLPENQGIGIDLGIKDFAVCSDGKVYKNINKSTKVKKLEKKLRRLQRKVSRKYNMNKTKTEGGEDRYKFTKTNNIRKLEYEIQASGKEYCTAELL